MRKPDSIPGRLPPEWLLAIRGPQRQRCAEPPEMPAHGRKHDHRSRVDGAEAYEHAAELSALIGCLKRERLGKGLSLGDVARLTRQARSAISRLESGEYNNPTLHTLFRYARALGWNVRLSMEPMAEEARAEDGSRNH